MFLFSLPFLDIANESDFNGWYQAGLGHQNRHQMITHQPPNWAATTPPPSNNNRTLAPVTSYAPPLLQSESPILDLAPGWFHKVHPDVSTSSCWWHAGRYDQPISSRGGKLVGIEVTTVDSWWQNRPTCGTLYPSIMTFWESCYIWQRVF